MRLIFYVVVGVVILTLLRSVLEAVGKAFSSSPSTSSAPPAGGPRGQAPQSLKKDPVCGTFVSTATAMQKSKGGETYYFCSAECRDKF
jgi:hypothetical protein